MCRVWGVGGLVYLKDGVEYGEQQAGEHTPPVQTPHRLDECALVLLVHPIQHDK
jgi:hypothetical protein